MNEVNPNINNNYFNTAAQNNVSNFTNVSQKFSYNPNSDGINGNGNGNGNGNHYFTNDDVNQNHNQSGYGNSNYDSATTRNIERLNNAFFNSGNGGSGDTATQSGIISANGINNSHMNSKNANSNYNFSFNYNNSNNHQASSPMQEDEFEEVVEEEDNSNNINTNFNKNSINNSNSNKSTNKANKNISDGNISSSTANNTHDYNVSFQNAFNKTNTNNIKNKLADFNVDEIFDKEDLKKIKNNNYEDEFTEVEENESSFVAAAVKTESQTTNINQFGKNLNKSNLQTN